jgi:hypothetical protein
MFNSIRAAVNQVSSALNLEEDIKELKGRVMRYLEIFYVLWHNVMQLDEGAVQEVDYFLNSPRICSRFVETFANAVLRKLSSD